MITCSFKIPILFFGDKISAGIEGSRDIRYRLDNNSPMTFLKTGKLRIVPAPGYKPGCITDLLRIESHGNQAFGFTLDLPLDQPITLRLIAG